MLDALFGSQSERQVLLFMQNYDEGYGADIARTFDRPLFPVRKRLQKMEENGWLVSRLVGKTRVYSWNPRNPRVKPLREFLQTVLDYLPEDEIKKYFRARRRPRRFDKSL